MALAETEATRLAARPAALTVAQVVGQIRALIEQRFPSPLWIQGELSNCTYAASGHIYFSLVDETATDRFNQRLVLPCAFFKGANQHLKFKLTDGLKVLCLGQVTTPMRWGSFGMGRLRASSNSPSALRRFFNWSNASCSAPMPFGSTRTTVSWYWLRPSYVVTCPRQSTLRPSVS